MNCIKSFFCNEQISPINIDKIINFSWELKNCSKQISYQIILKEKGKIIFDTQKIRSESVRHTLSYDLKPETFYKAELQVQTDNGFFKKSLKFRSALTNGFSKKARWITCKTQPNLILGGEPALYFKKSITIDSVKKSYIHIAGLGLFMLYINGKIVGNSVLRSPFTNYNFSINYETYDITKYLLKGENNIEVIIGEGWYNQNSKDTWHFCEASFKSCNKLLFEMNIGRKHYYSDKSWNCSCDGKIFRSSLRLGEFHDSNKVPTYNEKAILATPPTGILTPLYQHDILEMETFSDYEIIDNGENYFTIKFPVNMAGYVSFYAKGKKLDEVEVTLGDRLKDNKIDNESNSMYVKDNLLRPTYQVDKLILNDGENFFKPLFTFHGFQFATFTFSNDVKIYDIKAHFTCDGYNRISDFKTSLKRLNEYQRLTDISTKSCSVGIFMDCPHREKNGWTGDLQISVDQLLYNYNSEKDLYAQFLKIAECQLENGKIPCIAPSTPNIFGYAWGTGPAWDYALFVTPYLLSIQNNFKITKKDLSFLEKYLEYAKTKEDKNGLVAYGLGDWNAPNKVRLNKTPLKLTDSLYYYSMNKITGYFNVQLYNDDKGYYKKADEIKDAILKEFVNNDGVVASRSITSQSSVLYFDIVPEKLKAKVFENLLKEIERVKYKFYFGILGTRYLFTVLCKNNRQDVMIKLLSKSKYPSFGYWIRKYKCDSMFEDYEVTNSRNHFMYGCFIDNYYKYILGVEYHFENDKEIVNINIPNIKELSFAKGYVKSPNGIIKAVWKKSNGFMDIKLQLPSNVETFITLPNGKKYNTNQCGKLNYNIKL